MTEYLRVRNFDKFQHYKDRKPLWIKFYGDVLDDYEIGQLPDASKAHLFAIWLLASRYDNFIPHDTGWISNKINATEPVDLDLLIDVGFLEKANKNKRKAASKTIAEPEQYATLEKETETDKENIIKEKKDVLKIDDEFDVFWSAYPSRGAASNPKKPAMQKYRQARKTVEAEVLLRAARRYAEAVKDKDGEFIAQAVTWLNQARWEQYANAPPEAKTASPEVRELMLEAQNARGRGDFDKSREIYAQINAMVEA